MALNFNIPMPMSGIDAFAKGFGLTDNLMQQILGRNQLKQKTAHEKAALEQARMNHLENLGIQQQQQSRLKQMMPYQIQAYIDAHAKADPNREIEQLKKLYELAQSQGNYGGMPREINNPENNQLLHDQLKSMGMFGPGNEAPQGQGVMPIPNQPETPNHPLERGAPANTSNSASNLMQMIVGGVLKKKIGVNPFAQTPEDKEATALDLFNKKERIKAQNKAAASTTLTDKIRTKYQSVIGGAKSALPIIDSLIAQTRKGEIPGQAIGAMFKRDAQASYLGEISTLLDGIRNAYTIPNTDSGTEKAEDKVLRKKGESDDNYMRRLKTIRQQIVDRDADARAKLAAGNIEANAEKKVTLYKDGVPHDVPESGVVDAITNWGYTRG
jgi:predicted XRE-type DNA-binding protein